MSPLPPKADMCSSAAHVRFGPKGDIAPFVVHWRFFVGAVITCAIMLGSLIYQFGEAATKLNIKNLVDALRAHGMLEKLGFYFLNQMETGPGGKQIQLADPDGNPHHVCRAIEGVDVAAGLRRYWRYAVPVDFTLPRASAAVAHEAQQEQKQVDEVEIKCKRPHHRLAAGNGAIIVGAIHLLNATKRGQAGNMAGCIGDDGGIVGEPSHDAG